MCNQLNKQLHTQLRFIWISLTYMCMTSCRHRILFESSRACDQVCRNVHTFEWVGNSDCWILTALVLWSMSSNNTDPDCGEQHSLSSYWSISQERTLETPLRKTTRWGWKVKKKASKWKIAKQWHLQIFEICIKLIWALLLVPRLASTTELVFSSNFYIKKNKWWLKSSGWR